MANKILKGERLSVTAVPKQNEILTQPEALQKTRVQPSKGWIGINLAEVWQYRELLYFLVWRDVKVRYKQTVMGALWAIIQPFLTMVVFSLFFGKLAKMPSEGIPYPIFAYAALVPWTFFANALSQASNSLVVNANMIKKIYFPRLVMPVASVLAGVVDFFLAFIVLVGMILYYKYPLTINVVWLPFFVMLAFITALGVGLWLAAMNVQFRDVRYTIPFIIQVWLFATPIAYPSSILPEFWQPIYGINPMVGVVEGFRWALLGTDPVLKPVIIVSFAGAVLLLVSGAYYFRRMEKSFADVV